ncbi:MAG TPA: DUF4350 domain-containing protein [Terracidiphilus sp.]|nr:DUF4350 domain-containing protein [Terracidiphilus sp.]
MKLFASLDAKDRRLLLICLGVVVILAVITGVFARNENNDENTVPSSYLTGKHGARAAYDLLVESGYKVERWEQPLGELAEQTNKETVVILADPDLRDTSTSDFKAVDLILERGGRILVTGLTGGALVPDSAARESTQLSEAACKLTPQGLGNLAGSGEIWMQPEAAWRMSNPAYRADYNCAGEAAVVEYDEHAGHVVWWAGSTPIENASIARANNLDLFLNAIGSPEGHRFYWDESLHGNTKTTWSYAQGPAFTMLIWGTVGLALLTVLSFSRRRGPVRDVPLPSRSTPVEFIEALGSLYGKAGASATAVQLAYDRFRRAMGALCGIKGMQMDARAMADALRRRFPAAGTELEKDLAECESACSDDFLAAKQALALVQKLGRWGEFFREQAAASAKHEAEPRRMNG